MATLATAYRTEIIKSKHTFALWLAVLGAAFIPAVMFLIYLNRWESFVPKAGANPWAEFFGAAWNVVSFIFIPFFVVLLCTLVIGIEHKSNTWKQLFTLPVSKGTVYLSKLLIIISLTIACYVLFIGFLLVSGTVLGLFRSGLGFLSHTPDLLPVLKTGFKSFVSVLGILGIHYWLSIRLKNMILPIGIGLVGIVTATILVNFWKNIVYYPYAFTIISTSPMFKPTGFFADSEWYSLICFLIFSGLGYLDFRRFYRG